MFSNRPCYTTYSVQQRDSYRLNSWIKKVFLTEIEVSNSLYHVPLITLEKLEIWGMIKEIESTIRRQLVVNAKWKQNNAMYKHSQLWLYCNKQCISIRSVSFKFGFIALTWTSFNLQCFALLLRVHAWWSIIGILPSVEISNIKLYEWNYCFTYLGLYFGYQRLISV